MKNKEQNDTTKSLIISNDFKYTWIKLPQSKDKIDKTNLTTCSLQENKVRYKHTNRLNVKE